MSNTFATLATTSAAKFKMHKIPSANSQPYICVGGPDRQLWFCESGTSKIGRFNVTEASFIEFAIPEPNAMPIGITPGADGNMWFCAKKANKIGRIGLNGSIKLFPLPTSDAGPDGTLVGPDGNVWFSESDAGQIGRITPVGHITEFKDRHHARLKTTIHSEPRWNDVV